MGKKSKACSLKDKSFSRNEIINYFECKPKLFHPLSISLIAHHTKFLCVGITEEAETHHGSLTSSSSTLPQHLSQLFFSHIHLPFPQQCNHQHQYTIITATITTSTGAIIIEEP